VKITGLRTLVFAPRENHHQEVEEYVSAKTRQNGVAIISTDAGLEGVVSSEAGNIRQLARLWSAARKHLEGQDPFDRGKIATVLRRRFTWPQRILGVLDYGLWDIAGKAFNQPIYKLLGATREKVLAYGSTIHHATDERFIETTLACKEAGFQAVKLHPYCNFADDLRLVYKVRKAVGDEFRLMIDTLVYPAPYTRDEASRMGRALDELGYWWFEDPLPKTDLEGLAQLTRECQVVQIRAADRVEAIGEYAAMLKDHCMDIMAGPASFGITDLMKLAGLAEAHNMKMEPHDFGGGTASLHVLLAITIADYYEQAVPEGCFDTEIYPGVYQDPIRLDPDGYVHAPTGPGLGFGIDLKEAQKVTVEEFDSRK
jgi:L-alanine-DL-glutamate epimerase-like enolase superfamily enzyme